MHKLVKRNSPQFPQVDYLLRRLDGLSKEEVDVLAGKSVPCNGSGQTNGNGHGRSVSSPTNGHKAVNGTNGLSVNGNSVGPVRAANILDIANGVSGLYGANGHN